METERKAETRLLLREWVRSLTPEQREEMERKVALQVGSLLSLLKDKRSLPPNPQQPENQIPTN
jgi:hypothetical protein